MQHRVLLQPTPAYFSLQTLFSSRQVTFPQGSDPTELQPLLNACSPAGFGLGRQTVHDEAVRKALKLPADRLGLNLTTSLASASEGILDDIHDLMMPHAAGLICAEPYALNGYCPDGESLDDVASQLS
jgi:hypothetical protein